MGRKAWEILDHNLSEGRQMTNSSAKGNGGKGAGETVLLSGDLAWGLLAEDGTSYLARTRIERAVQRADGSISCRILEPGADNAWEGVLVPNRGAKSFSGEFLRGSDATASVNLENYTRADGMVLWGDWIEEERPYAVMIRLADEKETESVTVFRDKPADLAHDRFQDWRAENPSAYFLNLESKKKGILHQNQCLHPGDTDWTCDIDGFNSLTKKAKACAKSVQLLKQWASANGIETKRCRDCIPFD